MNGIVGTMVAGIMAFAATNVDDIVILTLFFTRVDETLRQRHIITGQYLGFCVLIAASLPGFLTGMLIPKMWLGWLGLLPIAIGIHYLRQAATAETPVQFTTPTTDKTPSWRSQLTGILHPQTYQVAAVTIANGGDNIGIYVPLFASSTPVEFAIIISVFFVMIGIWCLIARYLASHPLLSNALTRHGHRIVPFVLIGLGIFIFIDSGTYQMLMPRAS